MIFFSLLSNLLLPLGLLAFAIHTLRRTRDASQPLSPADRRWRMAAVGLLSLVVAGFGLCGGGGTVMGLMSVLGANGSSGEARSYGLMFLVTGLIGLAIAGACFWVLRRYRREERH
jgi:ABC-type transport system involved in cytochrome c biogenesis permease subunit